MEAGELNPHDMSVLVIDDDRIALEHAEIILGQIGIHCDTAESGWEGVDKVRIAHSRREDYNLILVDWRMPEMDGLETTRHIRALVGDDTPMDYRRAGFFTHCAYKFGRWYNMIWMEKIVGES